MAETSAASDIVLRPVPALRAIAADLWVADSPHRFIGLHIGTRMTIVRLPNGDVWLHSPIAISDALKAEIDAIGPVRHIVCPNLFHHMYAGQASAAWPGARRYGPEALRFKRPDLRLDATLSDTPDPDWQDAFTAITVEGSLLCETVFYHAASRTLISSDLVENFPTHPHRPTRWYLQLGGILGRIGWHPLLRVVYLRRRLARESLRRILELPFERIIIAHGELITEHPHEALRSGMAWLRI